MFTVSEDGDWGDPALPRIADPELRSQLIGYLRRAPLAGPGQRTDGTWTWPESLTDRLRSAGVGPPTALLDHIRADDRVSTVEAPQRYFTVMGEPTDLLQGPPSATEGTAVADGSWLTVAGWCPTAQRPAGITASPVAIRPLATALAGVLADQLCQHWFEWIHALSVESEPPPSGPRAARVFDSVTPAGGPAFSPNRRRIVELSRRDRLVRYLLSGHPVLRASGRMPDPLSDSPVPAVPLSFRTDGVWVWSEATAYYLTTRGIAPELAFLCHLEERAGEPPAVSEEVVRQAARVAQQPPAPVDRPSASYYTSPAGWLVRRWSGHAVPEVLDADLRWRRCVAGWQLPDELAEISEAEVSQILDMRWAARPIASPTRSAG